MRGRERGRGERRRGKEEAISSACGSGWWQTRTRREKEEAVKGRSVDEDEIMRQIGIVLGKLYTMVI